MKYAFKSVLRIDQNNPTITKELGNRLRIEFHLTTLDSGRTLFIDVISLHTFI